MSVADKIRLHLPDSVLWLCLILLLILAPVVLYMTHAQSALQMLEIRNELNKHRELMSSLRREAALLSSGYRNDPSEVLLESIGLYHQSERNLARRVEALPDIQHRVSTLWGVYQRHHKSFHTLIQKISSESVMYAALLKRSRQVFKQAEAYLLLNNARAELPLSDTQLYQYRLQLSEIFQNSLRFSALPDGEAAMELYSYIDQLKVDPMMTGHAVIAGTFQPVFDYEDNVRQSVRAIHGSVSELMSLPVYYAFEQFEEAFEQTIEKEYRQNSHYLLMLITVVVLLAFGVMLVTWRLSRSRKALEKSNTQLEAFKLALDEHAIVSITDARGVISYVNDKFVQTSGYQREELIGYTHRVVNSGIHPKSFFTSLWRAVMKKRVWHGEVCNKTKQGEHYWVQATVLPVYSKMDELESIISVRTDITHQKQIETALQSEKEKAEQASKAKSRFLANMSHEIRTPMNAIMGMSHLAIQPDTDATTVGYIRKIQTAAENLLGIINDILDFSKVEAGKLDIENTGYQLHDVIDNLAAIAEIKATAKGLPLAFDIEDDVPRNLMGDPLRLGQVLLNLVNNAIKFTESGHIRVCISLLAQQDNQVELRFSVKDTGIGLSQEAQQRLFRAFSQADVSTTRRYGGTGLGLAISKQLTELMGGQIGVFSEEGQGSEFFFTVRNRLHVSSEPSQSEKPPSTGSGSDQSRRVDSEYKHGQHSENHFSQSPPDWRNTALEKPLRVSDRVGARVLIAEDNLVNQEVISGFATRLGLDITMVADGEQAAQAALTRPFDLILMDIQMPVMDGIEATRKIQAQSDKKAPPVIAMTAHTLQEDIDECLEAGMSDHLTKPIHPEQLGRIIEQWIKPGLSPDVLPESSIEQGTSKPVNTCSGEIDWPQAMQSAAGNKALLDRLMDQFLQDYSEGTAAVSDMLGSEPLSELTLWLHTLKGVALTLGMVNVAEESEALEFGLREGISLKLADFDALNQALASVIRELNQNMHTMSEADLSDVAPSGTDVSSSVKHSEGQTERVMPDSEHLLSLYTRIQGMLQEGDAGALDLLEAFSPHFYFNTQLKQLAERVIQAAEEFEFERASERLAELESALKEVLNQQQTVSESEG